VRAERGIAECETWWHVGLLIQRCTFLLWHTEGVLSMKN